MPNTKVVGIIFPYILTPIPNLYDHSFPRYGQITFLTFRRPTTLTFDLKFWKYLSVTVYPYVICMPSFIMIGWEMAEILHFEILRKHGQTNTHTNTKTDRHGHYNTSPSPYGGRGNYTDVTRQLPTCALWLKRAGPRPRSSIRPPSEKGCVSKKIAHWKGPLLAHD